MSDENQQLSVLEHQGTDIDRPLNVQQVLEKVKLIQDVMRQVMKEGEHYGLVPGTGKKASLYKAGAEKLAMTFRLTPRFTITQTDLGNGHRDYNVVCSITNASGAFLAEGVGNCSTMETKYRYRKSEQTCPKCGKDTIIKGKQEYGGGWLCFTKKGGCGEKFEDGDPQIENQNMGRVEHDNPPDYWNTCLKMAKKRAHVDATLTATGASDMFTQDVEDMAGVLQRSDAPQDGKPRAPVPAPTAKSDTEAGKGHQTDKGAGNGANDEILTTTVGSIERIENKRYDPTKPAQKNNWKERYGIKLADDPQGRTFGTFDTKLYDFLNEAYANNTRLKVRVTQDGKYWNLKAAQAEDDLSWGADDRELKSGHDASDFAHGGKPA